MRKIGNNGRKGHISRRTALTLVAAGGVAMPFVLRDAVAQGKAINVGVDRAAVGRQRAVRHQFAQRRRARRRRDQRGGRHQGARRRQASTWSSPISTSTPTTAAHVAQRLITQNDVVAILGAFASSLTIAISEVTERRGVPLLTMSFSDQITGRGFKNIFQVVAKASVHRQGAVRLHGGDWPPPPGQIDKIAIMYEDTAYGTSQADRPARRRQGGRTSRS